MPDQVEVQFSVRESAELLATTREQAGRLESVIDSMSVANESLNKVADVIGDAIRAVEDNGGHVHDDGQVSGVNSSLLSVVDGAGESTRLYGEVIRAIAENNSEVWDALESAGRDVDNVLQQFGTNLGELAGAVRDSVASFASATDSAKLLGESADRSAESLQALGTAEGLGDIMAESSKKLADGADTVSDALLGFREETDEVTEALSELGENDDGTPGDKVEAFIDRLAEGLGEAQSNTEERGVGGKPNGNVQEILHALDGDEPQEVKVDASKANQALETLSGAAGIAAERLDGGQDSFAGNLLSVIGNMGLFSGKLSGVNTFLQSVQGSGGLTEAVEALTLAIGEGGATGGSGRGLLHAVHGATLGFGIAKKAATGGATAAEGAAAGGLAGALGRVAGVASKVLGPLSLIPAIIGAWSEGVDFIQDVKDVSVSQTGSYEFGRATSQFAENWLRDTFTGLDDGESQMIQQTLIQGRARYGSQEYNEGYGFASNARLNYGLEADKAARLYTEAVLRGKLTVEDLNLTLENLAEQSKETGRTMSELTDQYIKSTEAFKNVVGEGEAGEYAGILAEMGLEGDQQTKLEGTVGSYIKNNKYGSTYNKLVGDLIDQGLSVEGAQVAAALDQELLYAQNNMDLLGQPIGDSRSNLRMFITNRDWQGMESALSAIEGGDGEAQAQFAAIYQGLLQRGFISSKTEKTPQGITNAIKALYGEAQDNKDNGVQGVREADATVQERKFTQTGSTGQMALEKEMSNYSYVGNSVEYDPYGLMAQSQMQEQAQNDQAVTAGLRDGDITNEELDRAKLILMSRGVISAKQMKGMSDDALYKFLRETGEDFAQSDYGSFEEYAIGKAGTLTSGFAEYASQFEGITNAKEANELAAEITVKFEGPLGEFLEVTRANTTWQQKNDRGND